MKRVLIIGSSSFIGVNLAIRLRKDYRVFGTHYRNRPHVDGLTSFPLSLRPDRPLNDFLSLLKTSVIVYAAAIVNDPDVEKNPELAKFVNAEGPLICARYLEPTGGRLVFLSSSKVFSGEDGDYEET